MCCNVSGTIKQNFIYLALVKHFNLITEPLPLSLQISTLSIKHLPDITHITEPVALTLSRNHSETIRFFFVFQAPQTPFVLGHPWLQQYNPHINWKKTCTSGWGECHMNCLKSATPPASAFKLPPVSQPLDLSLLPSVYRDLAKVFRKDRVRALCTPQAE